MADLPAPDLPAPNLPVPDLDDLRFQPLVDAAKRALPQRAPEWTDHNVSDPGITLIEACAERVDQLLYRTDRMTHTQRSAVLRLMGIAPLPASPTRIVVGFRREVTAGACVIPTGTEVRTQGQDPVVLRTTEPLTLPDGQSTGTAEAVEEPEAVTETLGVADGLPGARFAPGRRPWRRGAPETDPPFGPPLTVRVDGTAWPAVKTFAEATPADTVHWWDDAAGEIVFGPLVSAEGGGEQQHGAPPPRGATVTLSYSAYRGTRAGVPAGTPLVVGSPAGLSSFVHSVSVPARDAESREQALERAGLGLAPLRRAVTAADHEQLVDEHVDGLARVRVTALNRPADSRVPAALETPQRPAEVLACAVAARDPQGVVHYYDDSGTVTHMRLPLDRPDAGDGTQPPVHDDDVPSAVEARPNAVIRLAEDGPRLWFFGDRCFWDGAAEAKSIGVEFHGLPDEFCADLDDVAVLADSPITCELFFFKAGVFYHRAYTYHDRTFTPREGGRGVRSLISESFPGLSPQLHDSPDAVAVLDGVFFFMKAARTEPALWRPEDAPLHVLLVPRTAGDPEEAVLPGEFDVPPDMLLRVRGVVEASRLLGARLLVGGPRYHSFGVRATVRTWSNTPEGSEDTKRAAERALRRYFHPTAGGPDGRGWPWGRRVHAGDVFAALEPVPEIHGTTEVGLTLPGRTVDASSVEVSDGGLVLLDSTALAITVAPAED
ncbi:hypothetical protein [Streptomyces sp. NBC_01006]|uniref:hypothetical protein n=1 Tax=Streptomyces sp. NBC_01006 TaxID=2903716 RepID=UPI003868A5CC|nr:hypothetical protein OG509_01020 [Streptomyces sp. NBC_01006]